jgi:hypothetical protein
VITERFRRLLETQAQNGLGDPPPPPDAVGRALRSWLNDAEQTMFDGLSRWATDQSLANDEVGLVLSDIGEHDLADKWTQWIEEGED